MHLLDRLKGIWFIKETRNTPDGSASLTLTTDEGQKRVALLTPREYELYLLLLEGFTLKESARQLSIKYSTANTHITSIYKKLKVNSRAELIIQYRNLSATP